MMLAATPPIAAPAGLDETRLLPAGARLDEFEILRPLGVGGFGIVYLALDHSLLRQVALKEFMPGELAARDPTGIVGPRSAQCAEQFERSLDSFFNEARLLAPFNHPALVRVYRFWKANGTAYMAMQYCPGMTLVQARRAMSGPPDEAWLRAVVEPILDALERLHRAGVYHRDLSPDNILLLPNGRPILLDFGSARRVVGDGARSLTAVLKPNFAPIEQYAHDAGMAQGAWTDLYALGATVHFMLTGKAPTPAVMRVVDDVRVPLAAAGPAAYPGVGANFLAAVDWAMAVAPNDRPQSVDALRAAFGDDAPSAAAPAAPHGAKVSRRVLVGCALATFGALSFGTWPLMATLATPAAPTPQVAPAPTARVAPTAATTQAPTAAQATLVWTSVPIETTLASEQAAKADLAKSPGQPPRPNKRPLAAAKSLPPAAPASSGAMTAVRASHSPAEACAGRNFISRALCLGRQCQAPGAHLHPECADVLRKEEKRQRWMDR